MFACGSGGRQDSNAGGPGASLGLTWMPESEQHYQVIACAGKPSTALEGAPNEALVNGSMHDVFLSFEYFLCVQHCGAHRLASPQCCMARLQFPLFSMGIDRGGGGRLGRCPASRLKRLRQAPWCCSSVTVDTSNRGLPRLPGSPGLKEAEVVKRSQVSPGCASCPARLRGDS